MNGPNGGRIIETSAWIERMFWRNVCMLLFVGGVVMIVLDFEQWFRYAILAIGGLAPGMYLIAIEQNERNVEENRRRNMPEARKRDQLPPLHPPAGTLDSHPVVAPAEVGWAGLSDDLDDE